MLTCLRVCQFAIIDELEIELVPGLNIVTGETGAGKSILVDALSLVLGGRGSADVVRTGAERADVEALFETAEGELVLRRSVLAGGRTRAYVNGSLATVAQLSEIAHGLVDVSSQHEHHTLVDPSTHLGFLDAYAGLEPLRDEVRRCHDGLVAAKSAYDEALTRSRSRTEREDLLRYQLGEIDAMGIEAGEIDRLAEQRQRLQHAEALYEAAGGAERRLYADDGAVCDQLGRIAGELAQAAQHDPTLEPLVSAVDGAREELEDAARQLGEYARDLEADPAHLAELEERWHGLRRLVRKYGGNEAALLSFREQAAEELDGLDALEGQLEQLQDQVDAAHEQAGQAARALSRRRREAASRLATTFTEELQSLSMGGARVEVEVAALAGRAGELEIDGARLTASGVDRAEFLIAPNPGEIPRPLHRVASGGELSRSLLALKRVLAAQGPVGLYVFDEVDAGIGGGVAEVIGRKLEAVAAHHQVVCITHLPQIAAYADAHFHVTKVVVGGRTCSAVRRLDEDERQEELARMLGGLSVTDSARAAAADLLGAARAAKRVG